MNLIAAHEFELASYLYEELCQIDRVTVFGPSFERVPRAPTVSFTVDGLDSGAVAQRLGEKGLLVWNGHFYAARVVEVLGLEKQGGLVRIGMSLCNHLEEVERLLAEIRALCKR
jgi:selenocysteine lyase/cysteine desulfurase